MLTILLLIIGFIHLSQSEEECSRNFSIRKNAIILTKSSQAKGANFIHKQVVSKFPECYGLCCSNPDCTVAVYENKVNHICFLFDCKQPNVCTFTEHAHYVSMMYVKSTTISAAVSRDKEVKSKVDINKPSVDGKLGDVCGTLRKCGPDNSMCTSGTCICQPGFIGRGGECVRSMCPKPELMFQCFDVTKMPFCIALYDQCNGLLECGDGSDEHGCDDKSIATIAANDNNNKKVLVPNKTIDIQHHIKTEKKIVNQNSNSIADNSSYERYEPQMSEEHQRIENINKSHSQTKFLKHNDHKLTNSHRVNPLIENQLLVLESKNNLPKYSHSAENPIKDHRSYSKSQRESDSNMNQVYENRQYSKLKTSSYPHLTKIDEYYQKNAPDVPENNNRWNHIDSYYSDYDYPQMNVNNRDQNADWYGDKGSNQYSDSNYPDSLGKGQSDRNSYSDYTDSSDDLYMKPSGRYLNDNDYYNSKGYLNKAFEQTMNHKKLMDNSKKKVHRIFIKPKSMSKQQTTTASQKEAKIIEDETDSHNSQEWSTAVIVLSLGLLITAGLLIAIGIKMRSWRGRFRKGKKGKSLTTDEGDYLINGMYL